MQNIPEPINPNNSDQTLNGLHDTPDNTSKSKLDRLNNLQSQPENLPVSYNWELVPPPPPPPSSTSTTPASVPAVAAFFSPTAPAKQQPPAYQPPWAGPDPMHQPGYGFPPSGTIAPKLPRVSPLKSSVRTVAVALVLGGAADFLFYGKSLGISGLIFVVLLLVGLFTAGRLEKAPYALRHIWLILPLLFFATMLFVRANVLLTTLNVIAVMALLLLIVFFYAADKIENLGLFNYPAIMFVTFMETITQPAPVVSTVNKQLVKGKKPMRMAAPVLRGLLLAIPVLAVFVYLLSSADSVFARYTNDFLRLEFLKDLPDIIWQIGFILAVAWLVIGGFTYAWTRYHKPSNGQIKPENLPGTIVPLNKLGFVEVSTVLILVNLLFMGFAWIQFTYLFFGEAASGMSGDVYKEYVRRGFIELLVASMLTLALIIGLRWAAHFGKKTQKQLFNGLSNLMIGLVIVMLVSAWQRMVVWENVEFYLNTELRMYVRSFIIWLGLAFAWLGLTMWVAPNRFAIGAFIAILGFLGTVNLMNPDNEVTADNLARYKVHQGYITFNYLTNLSDDAVPALVASLNKTDGVVQDLVRRELVRRLWNMESDTRWKQLPAFHVSRQEAYDQLKTLQKINQIPLCRPIDTYEASRRENNTGRISNPCA